MKDKKKQTKEALLKEIAHQLGVANALKKVEMCYTFSEWLRRKNEYSSAEQIKIMNDFNNAINMAYDA